MQSQGRSHHVWGGQVHQHTTATGVWGHAPPENFWNLEAKRLPLRPFLGQCNAPWRPGHLLISQATPFADEACKTIIIRLEEQKGVGRVLFRCSQPSHKFQHCHLCACGPCVGVCPALVLIGDAKQARLWQCTTNQATGKGKSGLIETRLTGPAATALRYRELFSSEWLQFVHCCFLDIGPGFSQLSVVQVITL